MIYFLALIAGGMVGFGVGYFVALHPADTRNFLEKTRAAIGRAVSGVGLALGNVVSRLRRKP